MWLRVSFYITDGPGRRRRELLLRVACQGSGLFSFWDYFSPHLPVANPFLRVGWLLWALDTTLLTKIVLGSGDT